MSNVDENSWPSIQYLAETIDKLTHDLGELVFSTISASNFGFDEEVQQKFSDFFQEFLALLAFDDIQLQLLKVFLLTFVSIVALIFIAWHIYGPRISEQFIEPNSIQEDRDSSSGE